MQRIEEINPKKIATEVIASLPHSLSKPLTPSSLEQTFIELPLSSLPCISLPATIQLGTSQVDVSSTKKPTQILVTSTCTILIISIPSASTIVTSIPLISAKLVEQKFQPSTSFLWSGKGKEEEIDLNEEILIPSWDITNLTLDQMHFLVNSCKRNQGRKC